MPVWTLRIRSLFTHCGWRLSGLAVGLAVCALSGGCARDNKLITGADWEFLDGRSKSAIHARPDDTPPRKSKVAKTETALRSKSKSSPTVDPFLNETVDDAVETARTRRAPSRKTRMLPLETDLPPEAEPPADSPTAALTGDEPQIRVSANRPLTAKREPYPEARSNSVASIQINPGAGHVEILDPPPEMQVTKTLPSEGQLVSAEQPADSPPETSAIAPEDAEPSEPSLPLPSLVGTPGTLGSPAVAGSRLPQPRAELIPTVELAGGIEQELPYPGDGSEPGEREEAQLGPGETSLPQPAPLPQAASMDGPRLAPPTEAPQTLVVDTATDDRTRREPEVDLLAPVPLATPEGAKLTGTSRIGLAIGLAGLLGIGLWRLLERRRFHAAN